MTQHYIRYEVVPLNEILSEIEQHSTVDMRKIQRPNGYWVGVTGLRLNTFLRASKSPYGMKCVACGLEATHFAVETSHGQSSTHLNLYGKKDDTEVLFTADHILARALGGGNSPSNLQMMCSPCNGKKGKIEGKEAERRREEKPKKQHGVPYGNCSKPSTT